MKALQELVLFSGCFLSILHTNLNMLDKAPTVSFATRIFYEEKQLELIIITKAWIFLKHGKYFAFMQCICMEWRKEVSKHHFMEETV